MLKVLFNGQFIIVVLRRFADSSWFFLAQVCGGGRHRFHACPSLNPALNPKALRCFASSPQGQRLLRLLSPEPQKPLPIVSIVVPFFWLSSFMVRNL